MSEIVTRESMFFDVVVVGAGPAGLAAAIRLKQLAAAAQREVNVCVVEKGAEVGAHILSGAVMDPKALSELLPDWRTTGAPVTQPVTSDHFLWLGPAKARALPVPPSFHNEGNYVISLGLLCRWLAEQAQELGVEIYPGFAASEILHHDDGSVKGIATGDMGVGKNGEPTDNYAQGMELHAQQTIFAEGCRGSLSKALIARFGLDKDRQPQTYGLGIKELWEIAPEKFEAGKVTHTIGWPLDRHTYGGGFLYHWQDNKIEIGFVVGLDYANPYLSPFEEFQRYKTHPAVAPLLQGARRLSYGARAIVEGGLQSLPQLSAPGAVLVGDAAGFLNVPRIKGSHAAIKSGMLAAEAVLAALASQPLESVSHAPEAASLSPRFEQSWLHAELHQVRNIRPSFKWGLYGALAYSALDEYVFHGKAPWTLRHHGADHDSLKPARKAQPIPYPKPDGVLTFDRLSSVFLSGVDHEENQPAHLVLKHPAAAIDVNYRIYASPETRYCPAGVYEIVEESGAPRLHINAQNCVHCKTCDIKDPTQNITWTCPEGGGGPNYGQM